MKAICHNIVASLIILSHTLRIQPRTHNLQTPCIPSTEFSYFPCRVRMYIITMSLYPMVRYPERVPDHWKLTEILHWTRAKSAINGTRKQLGDSPEGSFGIGENWRSWRLRLLASLFAPMNPTLGKESCRRGHGAFLGLGPAGTATPAWQRLMASPPQA